ncbi:growth-regulating factor 7-like [Olea europaea subsp. europaea]|nr:growth-regulating factor 7-like [Olea europaea subsp. europaea]
MGNPFTSAQRKELERQAMIYNYLMASIPVPADLLFPAPPSPSISSTGHLERCKRTDGKKWRCSRDVVPNHKYCERHLQKSRPRSRKPVEVKNQKKNPLLFNPKTDPSISTSSSKKYERGLGSIEGGMDAGQKWQHLVDASIGFGDEGSIYSSIASVFHRDYVQQQPLNMFQASEDVFKCIRGGESNIGAFYNPDLVFLDKQPRGLIDENGYFESSVSSEHGNLSTCSLDLSMVMGAGNVLDEEMRENQEEFGVEDSRLLRPVSWMSFAQGGPLAEALRPGSVAGGGGSIPGSPYDSISTTATTVSSPSGVLHWTLLSHSDSSVCNSPTTLAAATAPSQKPAKFLEN